MAGADPTQLSETIRLLERENDKLRSENAALRDLVAGIVRLFTTSDSLSDVTPSAKRAGAQSSTR